MNLFSIYIYIYHTVTTEITFDLAKAARAGAGLRGWISDSEFARSEIGGCQFLLALYHPLPLVVAAPSLSHHPHRLTE
jgi:hypothetical protein